MLFIYIAGVIIAVILFNILDRVYQRSLMKKFMEGGRRLSPISRRIIQRWRDDYNKLTAIAAKIDRARLDDEDRKNLDLGVDALNFFYTSIEPTIGTGVKRYKVRISRMLQNAAKIIVEISKKAKPAE